MHFAIVGVAGMLLTVAVDPVLETRIGEIFAVVDVELPPGASRLPVQTKLKKLTPSADADYRLRYAYVAALIHEKRYADALREVTALTKQQPRYLPAQRARAWILLSQKKYTEAFAALETIAKLISSQEGTAAQELVDIEAAQFLGNVMGFLEGPAENLVKEPVRTQFQTRIEARLTGKRREAYEKQRKSVTDLYADFHEQGEKVFAKAQDTQNKKLQAIRKQDEDVKERREKVEADAKKTTQQLRAEWDRLQKEWGGLRQNYLALTAEVAGARQQRSDASSQLNALERALKDKDGKTDSTAKSLYDQHAPGLRNRISSLDGWIAQCEVNGQAIMQNALSIEAQLQQLVVYGQEAGITFAMQDKLLSDETKAISKREMRAQKRAPKGPRVSERAHLYGTYDEFNFEAEKQRLLDSLEES